MMRRVWTVIAENLAEIAVGLGLVLITVALWSHFGRLSLVVPGVVLVWIGLPARVPFTVKPSLSALEKRAERRKEP